MKKLVGYQARAFLQKYKTTPDLKVLEIGAGEMRKYGDIFPTTTTLDVVADKHPDIVADAHQLPLPDASFDVIVCSEVMEHLYNPFLAVSEMKRVLKPGGLLLVTTRFMFPVHDAPEDYFRFTPYGLASIFSDWEILEEQVETDVFSTLAALLQRVIYQTTLRGGKLTKAFLSVFVFLLNSLDFLVVRRYGDVTKKSEVDALFSTGVFIACRKR